MIKDTIRSNVFEVLKESLHALGYKGEILSKDDRLLFKTLKDRDGMHLEVVDDYYLEEYNTVQFIGCYGKISCQDLAAKFTKIAKKKGYEFVVSSFGYEEFTTKKLKEFKKLYKKVSKKLPDNPTFAKLKEIYSTERIYFRYNYYSRYIHVKVGDEVFFVIQKESDIKRLLGKVEALFDLATFVSNLD